MNDLPTRKQNRIADYDYSAPGAYFITVCTANREKLFWNNIDKIAEQSIFQSDRRGEHSSPLRYRG